jgi:hypothetical protein
MRVSVCATLNACERLCDLSLVSPHLLHGSAVQLRRSHDSAMLCTGDDIEEMVAVVRHAMQACCQQLRGKLARRQALAEQRERKRTLSKYIPNAAAAVMQVLTVRWVDGCAIACTPWLHESVSMAKRMSVVPQLHPAWRRMLTSGAITWLGLQVQDRPHIIQLSPPPDCTGNGRHGAGAEAQEVAGEARPGGGGPGRYQRKAA